MESNIERKKLEYMSKRVELEKRKVKGIERLGDILERMYRSQIELGMRDDSPNENTED